MNRGDNDEQRSFSQILSSSKFTDKNTSHTYGEWYDYFFSKYRNTDNFILEVGCCVFGGGGLLALEEYFSKAQMIIGIDNACEPCMRLGHIDQVPRIKLYETDAYSKNLLECLAPFRGQLDIIIDDASHDQPYQVWLATALRSFISPDGIYIIEDCCTDQFLGQGRGIDMLRKRGWQTTIIDQATEKVYDNTLIILKPI